MGHDPVPVGIPTFPSLEAMYEKSIEEITALITPDEEPNSKNNSSVSPWSLYSRLITALSNVSSVLFYNMNAQFSGEADAQLHRLPINWCGFYLLDRPDRLALSAFQGKVACQHIKLGKGMCGKCVLTSQDFLVSDVHAEPGHITCDAASQSEAVIAIIDPVSRRAVGCLDIDSSVKGRFSKDKDGVWLRKIADLIQKNLADELSGLFAGISAKSAANLVPSPNPLAAGAHVPGGLMQSSISAVKIMPGGGLTALTTGALGGGAKMPPPNSSVFTTSSAPSNSSATGVVQHRSPNMVVTNHTTKKPSPSSSGSEQNPEDEGKLVKHKSWELRHRTVHEMLNSQKMEVLENSLGVKLLPEIIFGLNEIHFVMEQSAASPLKFRVCAHTALQNVVEYSTSEEFQTEEKDALFPIESASWEMQRKTMKTFDPKVDWAFRNNYRGVWSDASGKQVDLKLIKHEECEPNDLINYEMLRDTTLPIIFFAALDLWEDDLHDSGMSKMLAKARVMDPCFFVLVRHVLRVDGVTMQVRDTRHFHKFGSKKICIEETLKAIDIKEYLTKGAGKRQGISSEEFHRTLMNTPVEGLSMLEEKWKKNYVINI